MLSPNIIRWIPIMNAAPTAGISATNKAIVTIVSTDAITVSPSGATRRPGVIGVRSVWQRRCVGDAS